MLAAADGFTILMDSRPPRRPDSGVRHRLRQSTTRTRIQGITAMTMDKSLRVRKGSTSARGVLSRAERILKLKEQDRWAEGRSPLGLPKVRVYKMAMKKKKKAKAEEGAEGAAAGAKAPAAAAKKK